MNGHYTVIVVDGCYMDVCKTGTDSIRLDGLTWEEVTEVARLSFAQDYEIVLWCDENAAKQG